MKGSLDRAGATEDRELAARFGEAFRSHAVRTPAFLPSRRRAVVEETARAVNAPGRWE